MQEESHDAGSSRAAYPSTEDSPFGLHSSMAAPAHGFATARSPRRPSHHDLADPLARSYQVHASPKASYDGTPRLPRRTLPTKRSYELACNRLTHLNRALMCSTKSLWIIDKRRGWKVTTTRQGAWDLSFPRDRRAHT